MKKKFSILGLSLLSRQEMKMINGGVDDSGEENLTCGVSCSGSSECKGSTDKVKCTKCLADSTGTKRCTSS